MNAKISMFVICVKAIIYLLLPNMHDYTPLKEDKINAYVSKLSTENDKEFITN